MSTIYSYDLNGKKLSFANWVSNLSPEETPFCSMTKKEKVNQTMFQWQTDYLRPSGVNAKVEGHSAAVDTLRSTTVHNNYTQILRKVIKVSDTADSIASYGRGEELFYQTEKAGKELKRDLEWAFLNNLESKIGSNGEARETAGFKALAAGVDSADPATGAVTHTEYTGAEPTEHDLTGMMYNLYLTGSQANTIMYHPNYAAFFSSLQEAKEVSGALPSSHRVRLFENVDKLDVHVDEILSPWCQRFKLVPNRFMPKDAIYFFNPKDFTQMVLREPKRMNMTKTGSSEKVLIEMEAGLKLDNPHMVGVLKKSDSTGRNKRIILKNKMINEQTDFSVVTVPLGASLIGKATIQVLTTKPPADDAHVDLVVYKDGKVILREENVEIKDKHELEVTFVIKSSFEETDVGHYKIVAYSKSYYDEDFEFDVIVDRSSSVLCEAEDFIESVTASGLNLSESDASLTVSEHSDTTFVVKVRDTAYEGLASLVKSGRDGSVTMVGTQPLFHGGTTFTLKDLKAEDAGEYAVAVSHNGCVQRANILNLNIQQASVRYPFKPGTIFIDGMKLEKGASRVKTVVENPGDEIDISYELFDEFAGENVELVTSFWSSSVNTHKGTAGVNAYKVAMGPARKSRYFLRIQKEGKTYLSPSFSVRVLTAETEEFVTNLFSMKYSYAGGSSLNKDDRVVLVESSQLTRADSAFFAVSEKNLTGEGSVYTIVDTANPNHKFTLTETKSDPAGSKYTYRYFGIPKIRLADSGRYTLRATKGNKVQDSKSFTMSFIKP